MSKFAFWFYYLVALMAGFLASLIFYLPLIWFVFLIGIGVLLWYYLRMQWIWTRIDETTILIEAA